LLRRTIPPFFADAALKIALIKALMSHPFVALAEHLMRLIRPPRIDLTRDAREWSVVDPVGRLDSFPLRG
jgi:hypothetical protein